MNFLRKKISQIFCLENNKNDSNLYTLYSLRFIFFVLIFVTHCYWIVRIPFLKSPGIGVSGFIILSGFLNSYLYLDKVKLSFKNMVQFTKKRIKKIYPIYLLMIFFSLPLIGVFSYVKVTDVIFFFKNLFLNLLFLQSWFNNSNIYYGFNGVTWFLSTYMFLTFITIPLLYIIKKVKKQKYGNFKLILLSILCFIMTMLIVYISKTNGVKDTYWMCVFPTSRIHEYFIGMVFGALYNKDKSFKHQKLTFTFLEILAVCLLIPAYFIKFIPNSSYFIHIGINQYLIPLVLIIYILAYQQGYLSSILKNKITVYLGQISMYMYMIHQIIIKYVVRSIVHARFLGLYMFILTIIISILIDDYIKIKKSQNKFN